MVISYIIDTNVVSAVINGDNKIKNRLKVAELREQKLFVYQLYYLLRSAGRAIGEECYKKAVCI